MIKLTLNDFLGAARARNQYLSLAVHGVMGENRCTWYDRKEGVEVVWVSKGSGADWL